MSISSVNVAGICPFVSYVLSRAYKAATCPSCMLFRDLGWLERESQSLTRSTKREHLSPRKMGMEFVRFSVFTPRSEGEGAGGLMRDVV